MSTEAAAPVAPPPEVAAEPVDPVNPPEAPAAAPAEPAIAPEVEAAIRKKLEKEGRNALVAARIEERKAKQEAAAREAKLNETLARIEAKQKELEALEKAFDENPYETLAKRRGKSELDIYNEHTKRLLPLNATTPEARFERQQQAIDELRAELKRRDEIAAKEKAEAKAEQEKQAQAQRAAYEQHVEGQFKANVAQMIGEKTEWPLMKGKPAIWAAEAFRRLREHHDTHNGELLDIPDLLGKMHLELEEELKGYLPHLQSPQGVSDRDGAVQSAKHEAKSTPRTLTNGIASQSTGRSRPKTAKELAIEGDEILLRRS